MTLRSGKAGDPPQEIVHGQTGQVNKLHRLPHGRGTPVRASATQYASVFDLPATTKTRRVSGWRRRARSSVGCQVHGHRDADDIGAQLPGLHLPLIDRAEDDGHSGKSSSRYFRHEIQRGGERGDDDVDLPARVFPAEEIRQLPLVPFVREAGGVEVFVIDLDPVVRACLECGSEAFVETEDSRLPVAHGVEHEHPLDVLGGGVRGGSEGERAASTGGVQAARETRPRRHSCSWGGPHDVFRRGTKPGRTRTPRSAVAPGASAAAAPTPVEHPKRVEFLLLPKFVASGHPPPGSINSLRWVTSAEGGAGSYPNP